MSKLFFALVFISATSYSQTRYNLDSKIDLLKWRGEDVLKSGHGGTIKVQSGYILVSTLNEITKGEFTIDMNSLRAIDERSGKGIEMLDEHLKSDDFFSVSKFPNAFFTIIKIKRATTVEDNKYVVEGFLSIKGIINRITFPATITNHGALINVKGDISFDRIKWNITYQSKNFLNNLKDTAIADEIKVSLELLFRKN